MKPRSLPSLLFLSVGVILVSILLSQASPLPRRNSLRASSGSRIDCAPVRPTLTF